jgi:hypothetical protein
MPWLLWRYDKQSLQTLMQVWRKAKEKQNEFYGTVCFCSIRWVTLWQPPGVVEELINIPEIQRELFACLQHLAALLTQNQGQGRSTSNSGAAHEAALLLSRAETVKAMYLTPKTSSLPNA